MNKITRTEFIRGIFCKRSASTPTPEVENSLPIPPELASLLRMEAEEAHASLDEARPAEAERQLMNALYQERDARCVSAAP